MAYRIITELPIAESNLLGTEIFNQHMSALCRDNGIDGRFSVIGQTDSFKLIFEKDTAECLGLLEIRVKNGLTVKSALTQQLADELSVFEPDFKITGVVNAIISNLNSGQLDIEIESMDEFIKLGDHDPFPLFSDHDAGDGLRL